MTTDKKPKPELSPIYNIILEVEPQIRGVAYKYTSEEDFKKIDSVEEMQLVYWSETIQRVHVCSATSIKRVKKWFEAAIGAYDIENYYGFCSALRGLIEACADTFYTSSKIIEPICTHFEIIETALRGDAKKVLLSEEIEDELVHYVFARKLTATERNTNPPSHKAKQVRAYLESIDDPEVTALYAELCQVSHPSTTSLLPFILSTDEHSLILHKEEIDSELNDGLLKRNKKAILSATSMAVLPSMCLLKLINEFDVPITEALQTPDKVLKPAIESDLWKDMESKIIASKK